MYRSLRDQIRETPLTDKNIILDIDETLIYSTDEIDKLKKMGLFSDPKFIPMRERIYVLRFEKKNENIWGIKRPHIEKFLIFCFSYFKRVIVWSAGTEDYVKKIVDHLFRDLKKPDLIYTREDCIFEIVDGRKKPTLKPLSKIMEQEKWLGLNEQNTVFIDDSTFTFKNNQQNAIHIPKFNFGDDDDEEDDDDDEEGEGDNEEGEDNEDGDEEVVDSDPESSEEINDSIFKEENSLAELIDWFMRPEVRNSKDIRSLEKNIFSRKSTR